MQLYFAVPDTATTHDGVLVRSFLRQCAVSTDLARAVKFRGGGFFADGVPVLANRRIYPGQMLSFALPPEGDGVTPQPEIPVNVVYEDAFAVVLECIPAKLAELITKSISIPTIGIGAGNGCDGQVLVYQDMLGLYSDFTPKFVKRYAEIGPQMENAIEDYISEVKSGAFPAAEHTFALSDAVIEKLY
mgnify:CR=1 FL=1